MGNIIKHLRGTSSDHETYTGEKGVISVITNEDHEPTGEIRVHDGKTAGGIDPLSELKQMVEDLQNRVAALEGS
ncbi:MAG: hypothetical protein VW270_00095 [Candidatus Poseidoniales archaeon]